jgi:tetratricopeptide (TPR) repeat protein
LTRVFASSELHQNAAFAQEARQRWIKFLVDLCREPVGEYYWRYRSYAFYHEGENILDAIDWVYDHGNASDLFLLSRAAYDYLEVIGDWNSIILHAQRALTLAESVQEPRDIARFANILGGVHYQRGDYDKAGHHYQLALDNYRLIQNLGGESITLQHQSSLARKLSNFEHAKALNDQAWDIAESLADGDLKALLEMTYGKLARDMGQWNRAWEHFSNIRDYFEERVSESPRDEPLARSVWGHLAIVAVHLGRPQQAKEYCLRSLEYFEKRGTRGFLATVKYRLALAELALHEYPEALQHLTEAMEWFDRLGMKPDYTEAEKTYQELRNRLQQQLKE